MSPLLLLPSITFSISNIFRVVTEVGNYIERKLFCWLLKSIFRKTNGLTTGGKFVIDFIWGEKHPLCNILVSIHDIIWQWNDLNVVCGVSKSEILFHLLVLHLQDLVHSDDPSTAEVLTVLTHFNGLQPLRHRPEGGTVRATGAGQANGYTASKESRSKWK